MIKKILIAQAEKKKPILIKICEQLDIELVEIEVKDYNCSLGSLAKIDGFKKNMNKYEGSKFPSELLVFSGMNSDDIDIFLKKYKESGLESIVLKAMITEHNISWSLDELYKEILKEHLSFLKK